MTTPALSALAVLALLAGAAFLFHRFPHWGMRHHYNRPAPGVTEARYRQMYATDDDDCEFMRGLLARLREQDQHR